MTGAGDGNRTHVRSLGSFYTAIVRRPLDSVLPHYTQERIAQYRCSAPVIRDFVDLFVRACVSEDARGVSPDIQKCAETIRTGIQ